MPYLITLVILALSALVVPPQHARADALASVRGFLEMGKRNADVLDELIVGLGVAGDVTFGRAKPKQFRFGPAFELRTVDFYSLEAAAGAAFLIPTPGETAFGLYGLVGAAARKQAPDGMVGIGKLTWGFRGHPLKGGWYGYGLNVYGAGRKHIGDENLIEWTGGVEVDMQFVAVIPLLAIRNFVTAKDPYEEVEKKPEDDEEAKEEPSDEEEKPPALSRSRDDDEEEEDEEESPSSSSSSEEEEEE